MKITDKTTPTGRMTEARARELLETPGTVFVLATDYPRLVTMGRGWVDLDPHGPRHYHGPATDFWLGYWRDGHLHFRAAELILRDFVEGEG